MPHFASLGFGPSTAVTNRLEAASEKQPLSVQDAIGCCLQTIRPRYHISKVAGGFPDHVRNDVLLLGVHLDVLLDHAFTIIKVERHGLSSSTSDHLSSSFRPKAFSRTVILVVLLKRGYLLPVPCSAFTSALWCGSPSSLAHSRKIVALYVSDSSRACPTSLFLFSSVSLELHGRGVTRQTCLARFWRFLCMFPSRARIPATSQHPWLLSCGPLWQPAQRDSREVSLSSMFGNLTLLRGHRLATNSCNSCPSIPPTSSAFLTSQFCSSPSQTRGKPHWGSSHSPFPLAIIPRQVSAPFVP